MNEIEKILKPNVYVFAFHLIGDTSSRDNPLWNWGEDFLESFTTEKCIHSINRGKVLSNEPQMEQNPSQNGSLTQFIEGIPKNSKIISIFQEKHLIFGLICCQTLA